MDWVTLKRDEIENDLMPPVCVHCGDPATRRHNRTFEWHPEWAGWLLLAGFVPGIVAVSLTTRKRRVSLPVCEEHHPNTNKPFEPGRVLVGMIWLLVPVTGALVGLAIGLWLHRTHQAETVAMPVFTIIGGVVGALIVLFVVIARASGMPEASPPKAQPKLIEVQEISADSISLVGVSDAFIKAMRDQRTRGNPLAG